MFDAGDDIVTQTTTWQFAEEGFCRRTISSFSANEGVVRTETRDCSFAVANGQITITLSASAPATYRYSFAGFSPDRLVLDDLEYRRVA